MKRKFTKYPNGYIHASSDLDVAGRNEFANRIPMDELYDYIRKVLGIPDLQFETTMSNREIGGSTDIYFESNNFVDKLGCMNMIFSDMCVYSCSRIISIGENAFERSSGAPKFKANTTGEYKYWVNVGICFHTYRQPKYSGDEPFMRAAYSDKYGWEFALDKEI